MTHRTHLIDSNWKMHKTSSKAFEDAGKLMKRVNRASNVEVAIAPTDTALFQGTRTFEASRIAQGAQDQNWEPQEKCRHRC